MIYLISVLAILSAVLAFWRPSIWSMFAAGVLNTAAAWFVLSELF